MCLTLRPSNSDKPYNRSTIRWKVAYITGRGALTSQYKGVRISRTKPNKASRASFKNGGRHAGVHVYVNRKDATDGIDKRDGMVLLRVKVKGFLRSGTFGAYVAGSGIRDLPSETWCEYRVLSVIVS